MSSLDPLGGLVAKARGGGRNIPPSPADLPRGVNIPPVSQANRSCGRDIRLPRPGELLSRHYRGREITVRVLESGFEFDGKRYRSLSGIALAVTGAHWNGLLFFGLARQER